MAVAILVLALGDLVPAGAAEVLLRVGNLDVPAGTVAHGDAIAVGGKLDIEGTVEGDAVAIGGSVEVGGRVTGSVRAVEGDVTLGPTAVVGGTATAMAGRVRIAPGASVGGVPPAPSIPIPLPVPQPVPIAPPWWGLPALLGVIAALHFLYWLVILLGLAGFVGMNWLTAALFPRALVALAGDLERMPAAALVAGVIGWVLLWPVIVILALTVVGLVLVVLIPALLLIAIQFGVTAVALLAGRRLHQSGLGREVLVGSVVLAIVFAIPHLGWLLMLAAATWGWGAVLLVLVERVRARRFPPAPPQAPAQGA